MGWLLAAAVVTGVVEAEAQPTTTPPANGTEAARTMPTSNGQRPYGHFSDDALRAAIRKAAAATRAARRTVGEAEASADRAEQQAAAGSGPNVLALRREHDDLTARADAITKLRAVNAAVDRLSQERGDVAQRLQQVEQD
ncbi:hypothetical protein [Streptomyces sp. NPDC018045]|uniref:hypothetical protein n=1 Tax=Streptomyces sp. NPDC018045 TaxID=3365037 RepID=UPI0037A62EDE